MPLSKEALELIKQLATKTPLTVTGESISDASKVIHEVVAWVDGELKSPESPVTVEK